MILPYPKSQQPRLPLRPPSGSARSFLASSRLLGYLHLRDLKGPFEEMMGVVTLIVA